MIPYSSFDTCKRKAKRDSCLLKTNPEVWAQSHQILYSLFNTGSGKTIFFPLQKRKLLGRFQIQQKKVWQHNCVLRAFHLFLLEGTDQQEKSRELLFGLVDDREFQAMRVNKAWILIPWPGETEGQRAPVWWISWTRASSVPLGQRPASSWAVLAGLQTSCSATCEITSRLLSPSGVSHPKKGTGTEEWAQWGVPTWPGGWSTGWTRRGWGLCWLSLGG